MVTNEDAKIIKKWANDEKLTPREKRVVEGIMGKRIARMESETPLMKKTRLYGIRHIKPKRRKSRTVRRR